jgi:hypothetical protein
MSLKVILMDTDEQVCVDTGIEVDYDFNMLYIHTSEEYKNSNDVWVISNQTRMITQDNNKFIIKDSDDTIVVE